MIKKCIHDRMIKDENDKYICYAVDDEDWRQEGDEAWDDVIGKELDADMVKMARQLRRSRVFPKDERLYKGAHTRGNSSNWAQANRRTMG